MSTDTLPATRHDIPDATPPERFVYVLQSVVGDARGGTARYTLTTRDGAKLVSLPVELREGHYNVTAAFGGANPLSMAALDAAGDGRVLTLTVSDLPSHCAAAVESRSVDVLTGSDLKGRIVIRVDITCAEETPDD